MARFTLSKQERLSSLKEIERLFSEGRSLTKFPFRILWTEASSSSPFPVKAVFSVSKKKFPRAVDRNRIKRLIRESYRLLKPDLYDRLPNGSVFNLGIIYVGNDIMDFESIQKSLSQALDRMITLIPQNK